MTGLLERFAGDRARLVEALGNQRLIQHDAKLADAFADHGELVELDAGETLITQGAWDDGFYFILVGGFDVVINNKQQAVRGPGVHIGELISLDTASARTATIVANTTSLVLKVSQKDVQALAGDNVEFVRAMAAVLKERLDERNAEIGKTNDIPRVFVISSSEGVKVMDLVTKYLDGDDVAVDRWDDGTFGVSDYPISSLMDAISACDFTISIVRADDVVVSRKRQGKAPRDNVSLEFGLSLGLLGRRRSMLLVCADEKLKLPTDAAGLTYFRYQEVSEDALKRSVRTACLHAKDHILAEGVFPDRRA